MAARRGELAGDGARDRPRASRDRATSRRAHLPRERTIVCWAMGLTQHRNAVATIREIVNVLLLRGNIGKPGAGVCPGPRPQQRPGRPHDGHLGEDRPSPSSTRSATSSASPRRATHGFDAVRAIRGDARRADCEVFVAWAATSSRAISDTDVAEQALRNAPRSPCRSRPSSTAATPSPARRALILPCLGRTEDDLQAGGVQRVTVEDSVGTVHASHGAPQAPRRGSVRSEVGDRLRPRDAHARAAAPGRRRGIDWEAMRRDYDRIRDRIARVVPGFDGLQGASVDDPGGFAAAPPASRHPHLPDRRAARPSSRVNPLDTARVPPGRLLLQTIRSHDQFNTTIYGLDDRYRGIRGGRRGGLRQPRRPGRARPRRRRARRRQSASAATASSAGSRASGSSATRRRAAVRRRYLPGDQRPRPPRRRRRGLSNTPTSKSVVVVLTPALA